LALAFSTFDLWVTDLVAGAWPVRAVPAIAGAIRTEAASSAAEIVFSMVVSLEIDTEMSGRVAGPLDHGHNETAPLNEG
jgi:hypothetical protein